VRLPDGLRRSVVAYRRGHVTQYTM
jgi:hypothetical protein